MLSQIHFDRDGLIPVIVQEETTNDVLMLAFMNEEALRLTLETGLVHFWSRSRQKLWQKGETSSHVQEVVSLHVNCENNSLLLRVHQRGEAACHDGYHSCYYREWRGDDIWEINQPRLFDPAKVYPATDSLAEAFGRIYRAYEYLRDHDLEEVSGTSRRLRHPDQLWLRQRAGEELGELAGVMVGTHAHANPVDDTILEGRQVCYWLLLLAAAAGLPYEAITPHIHLRSGFESADKLDAAVASELARQQSLGEQGLLNDIATRLRLVGGACRQQRVSLLALARAELDDLSQKSYLSGVF